MCSVHVSLQRSYHCSAVMFATSGPACHTLAIPCHPRRWPVERRWRAHAWRGRNASLFCCCRRRTRRRRRASRTAARCAAAASPAATGCACTRTCTAAATAIGAATAARASRAARTCAATWSATRACASSAVRCARSSRDTRASCAGTCCRSTPSSAATLPCDRRTIRAGTAESWRRQRLLLYGYRDRGRSSFPLPRAFLLELNLVRTDGRTDGRRMLDGVNGSRCSVVFVSCSSERVPALVVQLVSYSDGPAPRCV